SVGQCLDFAGERGAGRAGGRAARAAVRVVRVSGAEAAWGPDRAARGVAAVRRGDRVPLSLRGIRLRRAVRAVAVRPVAVAVATAGGGHDSPGALLLD